MALLKREEWQGFVRDVDWTPTYVDDEAIYPEWHSGTGKVPREAWLNWEESYKVTYPEYVATQREKESSAYAVKAALQRSNNFDILDEGWKSATKMHFGGVALVEYAAVLGELKMARFGLNAAWRNMAPKRLAQQLQTKLNWRSLPRLCRYSGMSWLPQLKAEGFGETTCKLSPTRLWTRVDRRDGCIDLTRRRIIRFCRSFRKANISGVFFWR